MGFVVKYTNLEYQRPCPWMSYNMMRHSLKREVAFTQQRKQELCSVCSSTGVGSVNAEERLPVLTYATRKVRHRGICCHLMLVNHDTLINTQITHYSLKQSDVCVCSGNRWYWSMQVFFLQATSLPGGVRLTPETGCALTHRPSRSEQDVSENQAVNVDNDTLSGPCQCYYPRGLEYMNDRTYS